MTQRHAALVYLACVGACVPDPKSDPCRDHPASCSADAARGADGGGDAGADGKVADSAVQPPLDAEVGIDVDAARDLDSGMRDANRPRRDAAASDASVLQLQGDLDVHDPTIIEASGAFIIFSTGRGLPVKRSSDLLTWADDGEVFASNPEWVAAEVAGATDLWAPDISYFGGKYHLYYSASTFGSRNSCIGHATATDLAALDFVDHGPVICTEETDDYNAIDPAFVMAEDGAHWLTFGSFWSGIKLIPLDEDGQREGTQLYSLASRDTVEAIEAPYVVRHDGYYYLFVSFDLCCRGSASTYRIMVGRSANLSGPYADADGKPMLAQGGGTMVVLGNQRWRGPGHNAVLTTGADQYLVYHAYDADRGGTPTLRIAQLTWAADGWPLPVGP